MIRALLEDGGRDGCRHLKLRAPISNRVPGRTGCTLATHRTRESERELDSRVGEVDVLAGAGVVDEGPAEKVAVTDVGFGVPVDLPVEQQIDFAADERLVRRPARPLHAAGGVVDGVAGALAEEDVVIGPERHFLRQRLVLQQGQFHAGVGVDDVLAADDVDEAEVRVPEREELIERLVIRVGRVSIAAGGVKAEIGPRRAGDLIERVAALERDRPGVDPSLAVAAKLIVGLDVEVEGLGVRVEPRRRYTCRS